MLRKLALESMMSLTAESSIPTICVSSRGSARTIDGCHSDSERSDHTSNKVYNSSMKSPPFNDVLNDPLHVRGDHVHAHPMGA